MEIPQTASIPPNNDRPSFLTLPAEIRNMIYGLLFERDGPVMIHNVRGYYAQKPTPPERAEIEDKFNDEAEGIDTDTKEIMRQKARKTYLLDYQEYEDDLEKWNKKLEDEKEELKAFDHGLSTSLGLLKSCRQTYHEAASVLYGHNAFLITRVLLRHDCVEDGCGDSSYHQLNYAPIWLRTLGKQCGMLKKVEIDLSAACTGAGDCSYVDGCFELLPILRIIWQRSNAQCDISFANTSRRLHPSIHEEQKEGYSVEDIGMLNRVLKSLGSDDAFDLKRYAASEALLHHLRIDRFRDGLKGHVSYFKDGKPASRRFFSCTEDGMVNWDRKLSRTTWFDLPHALRHQIYDYATSSVDGILVDLDNRTTCGLDYRLFQAASTTHADIWWDAIESIGSRVPLSLGMASTELVTDFEGFQSLKDICAQQHHWREPSEYDVSKQILSRSLPSRVGACNIMLLIDVDTLSDEPRIKLNGLINLVCDPKNEISDEINLIVAMCPREEGRTDTITATMTLADLRRRLFFHFTELLDELPGDRWPWIPEIWIDKTSAFVPPAIELPSASVKSWRTCFHDETLIALAERIKDKYSAPYKRHRCWSHSRDGCMYCAWDVLGQRMQKRLGNWEEALRRHKHEVAKLPQ